MILVLDNYDSFTWNLVQALEAAAARKFSASNSANAKPASGKTHVVRADRISLHDIEGLAPQGIVLSPGPFGPDQTGICPEVVRHFGGRIPILGVCLGMQVIATVAGARVIPSGQPVHGKASKIRHDGRGLLYGLPDPFEGARYHSLIVDPASVPDTLEITAHAVSDEGAAAPGHIMGCRIRGQATEGVLFHPESFLTPQGSRVFENFMHLLIESAYVV